MQQLTRWQALCQTPALLNNPLLVIRDNLERRDGLYATYLGGHRTVLTHRPDLANHVLAAQHKLFRKPAHTYGILAEMLGDGLLTSDGPRWLHHRRAIQPGFHPSRIEAMGRAMILEAERLRDAWKRSSGQLIDWSNAMIDVTANIMGQALFGQRLEDQAFQSFRQATSFAEHYLVREIRVPGIRTWHQISGIRQKIRKMRAASNDLLLKVIRQRRADLPQDDLLQMLLDSRLQDTGEFLSDEDVLAEAATFYAAGHETTANVLSWFQYEVGQRSELQEQLAQEVESAAPNRPLTAEDVTNLKLLRATIEEVMRLHPAAWIVDREPREPLLLDSVRVNPGTIIGICLFALHRRPEYWTDPDEFQPGRFLDLDPEVRQFAYLPFGAGPRKCIGQHFAMMEMLLLLATWLRAFRFRTRNAQEVKGRAGITYGMTRPLIVSAEPR